MLLAQGIWTAGNLGCRSRPWPVLIRSRINPSGHGLPLEPRWEGFDGDPAAVVALSNKGLILCVPDRASRHNRAVPAGPQEWRKHSRMGVINLVKEPLL